MCSPYRPIYGKKIAFARSHVVTSRPSPHARYRHRWAALSPTNKTRHSSVRTISHICIGRSWLCWLLVWHSRLLTEYLIHDYSRKFKILNIYLANSNKTRFYWVLQVNRYDVTQTVIQCRNLHSFLYCFWVNQTWLRFLRRRPILHG